MVTLVCCGCRTVKAEDHFHRSRGRKTGRASLCKACSLKYQRQYRKDNLEVLLEKQRNRYTSAQRAALDRKWKYGISDEVYEHLMTEQGGVCAICQLECPSGRSLAVDHDHRCCPGTKTCGKCIRGLLCSRCNPGLGFFQDDLDLLRRAVTYLERKTV